MKNMWVSLGSSLLKTIIIASIIGEAGHLIGYKFLPTFIEAIIIQFIIFYLFGAYMEYKAARDARDLMIKEAEVLAASMAIVECANCKKESEVPIRFNQENRYTCGHCNTKNSIYITATTAVVTEPLYETNPLNKNKQADAS